MKKIAIIGGGGHAKVVASIILKLNKYEIIGYIDTNKKEDFLGLTYLGNDDDFIKLYKNKIEFVALGIGQIETSKIRKTIVAKYENSNFKFPTIISPTAIINKNVKIGNGTVVMDGVVVNVDSNIGDYSIINTNSTIEHDCKIGNYVHVAPGVTLSGEVKIEDNCLIGTGSNIIQGTTITSEVVLGAGSTVHKNIALSGVYVGNPTRKVK
ncbi:MAG: acetyltransferase [Flavobacteriaceae bacterium]|nr:acetyltransferase [Flavobacteriaceae bacterium]